MRIDMLGAPGVGKTTLCDQLARRRRKVGGGLPWLTSWQALSWTAERSARRHGVARWLAYRTAAAIPRLRRRAALSITDELSDSCLLEASPQWRHFLEYCIRALSKADVDVCVRLLGMRALTMVVRQLVLEEQSPPPGLVVWDESLSQRVNNVTPWTVQGLVSAEEYFELMPPPFAVIHLAADTTITVQRLAARNAEPGGTIALHRLSGTDLRECTRIAAAIALEGTRVLASRGVRVLSLDASQPLALQLTQAERFLQSLSEPAPATFVATRRTCPSLPADVTGHTQ